MKIVTRGPSLAALRRYVGTQRGVPFGDGSDAVIVRVGTLCAMGGYDLPIAIPQGPMTEPASAWFVEGDSGPDGTVKFLAIAGFDTNGRFQVAAMVEDADENSTTLNVALHLNRTFAEAVQQDLRAIFEV